MYSIDSDHLSLGNKGNRYMFSKFMRDLEELIDMEQPAFEKKITEMSSSLSMATAETNEKQQPQTTSTIDRKDSGISLTKTNSKSLLEGSDDENSDIDSETDDEEENQEIARCLLIDRIVKEANLKRCRGRWSTREIHEVKFNEDKLTIQFRTGRLGSFALALNRYCNFPFQSWELKPERLVGCKVFIELFNVMCTGGFIWT
jgi:cancer susceptibility candidate protein 1